MWRAGPCWAKKLGTDGGIGNKRRPKFEQGDQHSDSDAVIRLKTVRHNEVAAGRGRPRRRARGWSSRVIRLTVSFCRCHHIGRSARSYSRRCCTRWPDSPSEGVDVGRQEDCSGATQSLLPSIFYGGHFERRTGPGSTSPRDLVPHPGTGRPWLRSRGNTKSELGTVRMQNKICLRRHPAPCGRESGHEVTPGAVCDDLPLLAEVKELASCSRHTPLLSGERASTVRWKLAAFVAAISHGGKEQSEV